MKCDWVKENISLYAYNELADDARYELEQHVARCSNCAAELAETRQFHEALSALRVDDPAPNLVASSRLRLQEALETAEQSGLWRRLTFDPGLWLRSIRFAPALAAAILIAGFAGGVGATYRFMNGGGGNPAAFNSSSQPASEASITGISSVSQELGSNQVTIKYDMVSTQQAQGSLNDQRIQQLLLFAAQNNNNSGVRMDSVDLLTQKPNDSRVREALIHALRYDSNPGVRLKALEGLGPYVKGDTQVRNVVLEALMRDPNQGVRTSALLLLEPVRADSSVRAALRQLAAHDRNQYIRSQAVNTLAELPEFD
jgi:hypothetical protein